MKDTVQAIKKEKTYIILLNWHANTQINNYANKD